MTEDRTIKPGDMLDCGDVYVRPAEPGPTGYATTADGRVICYAHSDEMERAEFAALKPGETFVGYIGTVHGTRALTTWPGGELAHVRSYTVSRSGFGGSEIYSWRFDSLTDPRAHYYGRNGGPGMVIAVKRAKD